MNRYVLVLGDKTTAGGSIIGCSAINTSYDGLPIAVQGDKISCPACGTTGYLLCVTPRHNSTYEGKPEGLSGDLCICKCTPPPKLINSKTAMFHTLTLADLIAQGHAKYPIQINYAGESGSFDEQITMQPTTHARELAGLPYYIEARDGRHFAGTIGEDGRLPRIATNGLGSYDIHVGDDALGKG
ncbi:PAAR domain-containing protein [Rahnella sp. CG8]|jgi:uncharacterized Zn-binding protein involved in type VI secretion|uniref:PAAR domain-containing protein n=1 Tax=Rahnella sp. CG8 TaxID=2726078 RepID=UPI0020337070|nr:PAAR domain-containing protein [Rahnella sp. CG8]MCM2448226.1 PAAR domain-containing protein [Rahnella sp. CG8]